MIWRGTSIAGMETYQALMKIKSRRAIIRKSTNTLVVVLEEVQWSTAQVEESVNTGAILVIRLGRYDFIVIEPQVQPYAVCTQSIWSLITRAKMKAIIESQPIEIFFCRLPRTPEWRQQAGTTHIHLLWLNNRIMLWEWFDHLRQWSRSGLTVCRVNRTKAGGKYMTILEKRKNKGGEVHNPQGKGG